ncbi:hypothetical protein, partial [Candidatus Ichthyocystis sparus]
MKRKLSSTSSEASSPEGNYYRQGSANEQMQTSSVLDLAQNTESADAEGFVLDQHLAQALGMHPGEMIFRSMFYGTPQSSRISSLAAQLIDKHEELVRREIGEGTSSTVRPSDGGYNLALMASNEATIRALLDSIEAPQLAVVPSVVIEGEDTMHGQPSASEMVVMGDAYTMHGQPSASEMVVM